MRIEAKVRNYAILHRISVRRDHNGIYTIWDKDPYKQGEREDWHNHYFQTASGALAFMKRMKKNPFRLGSRRVRKVKSMRSPIHGRRKVTYRTKKEALRRANPGTLIYAKVTRIEATKGKDSQYPGEKFFHNFKRPYPAMYGLKDGSILIK
jgi:hypothetical protein